LNLFFTGTNLTHVEGLEPTFPYHYGVYLYTIRDCLPAGRTWTYNDLSSPGSV